MKLRKISMGLSGLVLLGMLCVTGFSALCIFPFYGFPPIVSIVLARRLMKPIPQMIVAMTSLGYGIWFAYLYYDAFYVHPDPQSGLLFVFVGIWAFPVVALLWTIAFIIEKYTAEGNET